MTEISEPKAKQIIGQGGIFTGKGDIRADEFLKDLKGNKAVQMFREMRDNDATIGGIMYATEQVLRDVPFKVKPANDTEEAKKKAEFVEQVLLDMEHSLDDHISEALSCLTFGFADFEVVYKRRKGTSQTDPKKYSKYNDDYIGVRKIASRAQWTIESFEVDDQSGDLLGITQKGMMGKPKKFIPSSKLLHYKTTTTNNDHSGRSILRNCYKSYTYLNNFQQIEAIAVEREMHGIPLARVPADYLSPSATEDQTAFLTQVTNALRDLKLNEQGYLVIPSDPYTDPEGRISDHRYVDVELIASQGKRSIDIGPIVTRYQHDIARSVMAEFLMLGSSSTGSYALSKSKTDLFLRALESYINSIYDVINKQLIEPLWKLNGFDFDLLPVVEAGDVAPHDLAELSSYLRNLNGASIDLSDQVEIVDALLQNAELPPLDRETYEAGIERKRIADEARNDYYDGPDNNVTGGAPNNAQQQPQKAPQQAPKKPAPQPKKGSQ